MLRYPVSPADLATKPGSFGGGGSHGIAVVSLAVALLEAPVLMGRLMEIHEFRLSELSPLSHRTFVCEFGGKWNPCALILEFSGSYRWGSKGNADANYISAIKAAALAVLHVHAVVFDFRNMAYEWGNRIWNVLASSRSGGRAYLPAAIVISDRCRKGFSTCSGMVPPMFDSLEDALRFVEGQAREHLAWLMRDVE
jgi:hypothetical protein